MKIDLAALFRRVRNPRRSHVPLRPIKPSAMLATSLYRAAYADVVRAWESALPDILATYERSLGELSTDSPADVSAVISRVEASTGGVFLTLRARLERWARVLEEWQRRKWRANVLAATGVDLGTMLGPDDARLTLEASIERNVALVRSVSDQARQRIADAVFQGLHERKPAADVARDFRDTIGMARRRALNIASDQTVKLASSLNDERRRQAGISTWEWMHSAKRHPRPQHVARNGHIYADDPEMVGQEANGRVIAAPPADRPGQLPFCGCTSRAVLVL